MENQYKDALRSMRKSSNSDFKLFQPDWTYAEPDPVSEEIIQAELAPISTPKEEVEVPELDSEVTEKTQMLDSLYQFSEEKLATKDSFQFPGGEVARKEMGALKLSEEEISPITSEEMQSYYAQFQASEQWLKWADSRAENQRILFISDAFDNSPETFLEGFFKPHVVALFTRMVQAMKVEDAWTITDLGNKTRELLAREILHIQPELIITLGASPTQFLLRTDKRLKNIHGQIYALEYQEFSCKCMPLFSPKLLSTAPNMKKTAWTDMQKAMGELNLL